MIAVHFQDPSFDRAYLHWRNACSPRNAWTSLRGLPMEKVDGWWRAEMDASAAEFTIHDGNERWQPGGVDNNLRTRWPETWVRGAFMSPCNPDLPRPADLLLVLSVNLRTWQESRARQKLMRVAEAVEVLRPDFVCLQECAQHRDATPVSAPSAIEGDVPIRSDHAALLVCHEVSRATGQPWRFTWGWAHYGFNVFEEGLAVMTPHPVLSVDQAWLSAERSPRSLDSRKAVRLRADLRGRPVDVVSTHLSLGAEARDVQIANLADWVRDRMDRPDAVAVVAGDFNAEPADPTLHPLRTFGEAWLEANHGFDVEPTREDGVHIDYVFYAGNVRAAPLAQTWFRHAPGMGGRVSDHCGVAAWIQLGPPA